MPLTFADPASTSIPLHAIAADALEDGLASLPAGAQSRARRLGFTGALGQALLLDGEEGDELAIVGLGTEATRARVRFPLAPAERLAEGTYHLASDLPADLQQNVGLGWLLSGYRFDRYKASSGSKTSFKAPPATDSRELEALAAGEELTRDLINTPAADMGPAELAEAAVSVAGTFGASSLVTTGEDLLSSNLPMIHAVGRAATDARAPRLIDMRWGTSGPRVTLVGKGVCFDTGGLNLKPGGSMGLMKKDMGGAAAVLGLAHILMACDLPIRLRVLIPAVENAVASESFRPQDVLTARNGMTVEINNTDAEGRLVLADALALAAEEEPDCLISMATLTGAARVAVGPDLAPFYTGQSGMADALRAAGRAWADPVWEMPFHEPYEDMIEPRIADLDNAPKGGFAGSITAALFLRRFAGDPSIYTHFDIYGWQPSPAPGRTAGGLGQGARAIYGALPDVLDL